MATPTNSAIDILKAFLDPYGLGSLVNWALGVYTKAGGGTTGMDAVTAQLPDTQQFQARFPAYKKLREEGRAMSIQEMLDYERTARQIFHAAGLPAGFYDQPQDFAKFMLNDVSTSELQQRVTTAQQLTINAPPDLRQQARTMYGLDAGHLTAHFLDPKIAEPILERQATAIQLGAEANRADVGQLTRGQGEELARFGVTAASGQTGFTQLGLEKGLYQAQVQGEQQVGLEQQLKATFEQDTQAQLAFQQRRQARLAAFQAQTGFGITQAGVGGLAQQRGI